VWYGSRLILDGVSLAIGRGEVVALLGGNGHGKSTVLKAVMGLVHFEGEIRLKGKELRGLKPNCIAQLGVAYVPQNRKVFPSLTVRENICLATRACGKKGDELLGSAISVFPELVTLLDRSAGMLSGGQQQLVALARALSQDPALMILDEPATSLAEDAWSQIREILHQRARAGWPILLVEHQTGRLHDLVERAYVLRNGRVDLEDNWPDILLKLP